MKFEVRSADTSKLGELLKAFTEASKSEYERVFGNIPVPKSLKELIPNFDTGYIYDKEKDYFLVWNTFELPQTIKKLGFMNPFKPAIKEAQKNLESFLRDSGVKDAKVKLVD